VNGSAMKPALCAFALAMATQAAQFFVAVDGDDANPGTIAQPFATLERARDAVRKVPLDARGDIVVNIRAGDYRRQEPLVLTDADSGREGANVVYRSYDGIGKARLLGSRPLTGWTRDQGAVWKLDVGKGSVCHTLYEGGRRARKARYPNYVHDPALPCAAGPYLASSAGSPELEKGVPESWLIWRPDEALPAIDTVGQLKINVFPWGHCDWHRWICSVTGIDTKERKITFDNQNDKTRIGNRARYFLEDSRSLLDVPGEFFLDEAEGVLYYIPMGDGHPDDLNVTLPVAKTLIRFQGQDREKRAHHIRIEGLSLAETDGLSPTRFWWQFGWGRTDHALVWMRNADHVEVRNCHLKNSGRNGVIMVGENTYNLVTGCWIEQMGVNGIALSNRFKNDTGPGPTPDKLEHNVLTNNRIHDVGQLSIYNACVNLMNGSHNEVSHSEFFNSPRYATTMRGNTDGQKNPTPGWHGGLPPAKGNRFHHLRVHHCGQDTGDMGALHTASVNIPDGDCINTFEQITITDLRAHSSMRDVPPNGIFLDWRKRSMHQVFRNIHMLRTQGAPFRANAQHNAASAVLDNVSWAPGFDTAQMAYGKIGLQPDFPAEFGGPLAKPAKLPAVAPTGKADDYCRIALAWPAPPDAKATGKPVYGVYRDGVLLAETTATAFTDTSVGERTVYHYRVTARNGDFGPTTPPAAVCEIRTPADLTPPILVGVTSAGDLKRVILGFSEPVDPATAADPKHYRISPDITVTSAKMTTRADIVVLTVSGLLAEQAYQLHVNGVTDRAVARNVVAADATAAFKTDSMIAHCTAMQAAATGVWRLRGGAEWLKDGRGLALNGRDGCAAGPAELNLGSGDFALAAWIWKGKGGSAIVAAKGNGFSDASEWSWGWEHPHRAGNIAFRSGNHYFTTATGSVHPDAWVHLVFSKKGTVGTSYVNGQPSGTPHDLSVLGDLTNTKPLLIGRRLHEPTPAWFNGKVADLRIYTGALSPAEVQHLATTARPGK